MLVCVTCGNKFERQGSRGPVPKYCPDCVADRGRARARRSMEKRRTEHHEEHNAYKREYYAQDPEVGREASQKWREANPLATAAISAAQRCNNPKDPAYRNYGGRGIEWRFASIAEFATHVGPRPTSQHTLDRICVNGHYEPGNVQWATRQEQRHNQRGVDGTCWCHRKTFEQLNSKKGSKPANKGRTRR